MSGDPRVSGEAHATQFAGTAEDYQRYRVPYPDEVFDWIRREYNLDGRGRLLDVGCGTGYACLPLSRWFEDVVAIDPEPDMLRVVERAARSQGVGNIRFMRQRAEEISPSLAPLRLVTFGNSFHWTDRVSVAHTLFPLIEPGGGLVALASSSVWAGEQPWQVALLDAINSWTGQGQHARSGRLPGAPLHQDVLRETPFGEPRVLDIVKRHTWSTDTLIGLLHSSSLQLRSVLGERVEAFERDLRERLLRLGPEDCFVEEIEFTIISCKRTNAPLPGSGSGAFVPSGAKKGNRAPRVPPAVARGSGDLDDGLDQRRFLAHAVVRQGQRTREAALSEAKCTQMSSANLSRDDGLREHADAVSDLDGALDDLVRTDLQHGLVPDAVRCQALLDQRAAR